MLAGGGKLAIQINTASLANGDSIAAYLVDAAGSLLTSTLVGSKQNLNVLDQADYATDAASAAGDYGNLGFAVRHDANTSIATVDGNYAPLQLDANGALKISGMFTVSFAAEYAEDSPATSGDIGIFTLLVRQDTLASSTSNDGDYGAFKSTALGELYTHDVSALAELVLIKGDTASIVTNTATIATNTGNIHTDLTALTHAQNAAFVTADKGVEMLAVRQDTNTPGASATGEYSYLQTWSEGSLKTVSSANGSILQQQVAVSSTAAKVPTTALATRKSIMLQNTGGAKVYIGSSTVTSSGATTGIELPAGSFLDLDVGPAIDVWAVKVGAGTVTVNVLEAA